MCRVNAGPESGLPRESGDAWTQQQRRHFTAGSATQVRLPADVARYKGKGTQQDASIAHEEDNCEQYLPPAAVEEPTDQEEGKEPEDKPGCAHRDTVADEPDGHS